MFVDNYNKLLIKDILRTNTQPKLPPLMVLLTSVFVLTGLSGSLQASPENTQPGHVEPRLYLNFSANQSITLSNMLNRSKDTDRKDGQQDYELAADLAPADGTKYANLRDYLPPRITLTQDSVRATKPMARKLEGVTPGTQAVKLTTLTLSSVDKLANNIDAAHTESEDNQPDVGKPILAEVVGSPFVTITLAGLALLGLVSVSRRHDL